jgi:hypothetical protein
MSKILLFPAAKRAGTAQGSQRQPPCDRARLLTAEAEDACPEEDAEDGVSLEAVARLAGAPSPTLNALAEKVEVLVARLAPEDGADAGLCAAEIRLLQSVLRDLRALAADLIFAVQGASLTGHGTA